MIGRRQQQGLTGVAIGDLYLCIELPRASALFSLFLSSSCLDSDGGASVLCFFPTHQLRVSVAKTGGSFLALQCELRPRLFAWLRCLPPSVRAAQAEFSAACSHCGARIPPTTIVPPQLVSGGEAPLFNGKIIPFMW